MVLYFVGLGLNDEHDITLRGLEVVRKCKKVFLEAYTSILLVDKARLEALYGREVEVADRELVESGAERILEHAGSADVALLVVGDPFGATTHADLQLRALERGVETATVHNASILTAVGATGLQLYRFGETVSLVFFTDSWQPTSLYPRIAANRVRGLHTLCLLDIKVREPTLESLARGRPVYEAPRFMSLAVAAAQLLALEATQQGGVLGGDTLCVGVARLGSPGQRIVAAPLGRLGAVDWGPPLHSLIIPGELHELEREVLARFMLPPEEGKFPEGTPQGQLVGASGRKPERAMEGGPEGKPPKREGALEGGSKGDLPGVGAPRTQEQEHVKE